MGKTTVSHRLDDGLLEWATAYANTRGTTRSVLLEEALRALRGLAEGGVPDLPVVDSPEVRQQRAMPGVTTAGALARARANPLGAERQARIEKGRRS